MIATVRYKSTADYVTSELQRLILSGELQSGARIDQIELAGQLEVSRHPVRQAIERLAERGFVTVTPHKGALVARMSADDLDELYGARIRLETWALREAWPRLVGEAGQIEALHRVLAARDPVADLDGYMAANRAFHLAMYQSCGNRHLLRMVTMLFDLSERYQRTALRQAARSDQSRREHKDMVEALARGDLEGLAALVETHNAGTREIVRPHLQ